MPAELELNDAAVWICIEAGGVKEPEA